MAITRTGSELTPPANTLGLNDSPAQVPFGSVYITFIELNQQQNQFVASQIMSTHPENCDTFGPIRRNTPRSHTHPSAPPAASIRVGTFNGRTASRKWIEELGDVCQEEPGSGAIDVGPLGPDLYQTEEVS